MYAIAIVAAGGGGAVQSLVVVGCATPTQIWRFDSHVHNMLCLLSPWTCIDVAEGSQSARGGVHAPGQHDGCPHSGAEFP